MKYNMGSCFNCGEDCDEEEEIGNTTVCCCSKRECQRELREERLSFEAEKRERAREDDYSRYDY
jgi:hypothetical protein